MKVARSSFELRATLLNPPLKFQEGNMKNKNMKVHCLLTAETSTTLIHSLPSPDFC
jgi:hypothetical protein